MRNNGLILFEGALDARAAVTTREVLAMGFRHKRLLVTMLLLGVLVALAAAVRMPEYESEMEILVTRQRLDAVASNDATGAPRMLATPVTEEELNSEIHLLTSDDILRKTVVSAGLQQKAYPSRIRLWLTPGDPEQLAIERATRGLRARLDVSLVKKSNTIVVRYPSGDPQLGARVLDTLAKLYLEKHAKVRRPAGQFEFFDRQVLDYRRQLTEAQEKLAAFPTTNSGVVAGETETTLAVQKTAEMNAELQQTRAAIAATDQRIATLQRQISNAPARMTTAVRKADNPQLMMELKSTLLQLELKRTELLQKFQPTYRPIQDLEKQIAEAKAAIGAAQKAPLVDETTDRDPTYDWMRTELARARTERNSLQARAATLGAIVGESRARAVDINKSSIEQQDLIRAVKTLQDNYDLYLRKREEARIADAFDQSKILNVALAVPPTVPALPARSPLFYAVVGLAMACVVSVLSVIVAEFLNPAFRSAGEAESYLGLPVYAVGATPLAFAGRASIAPPAGPRMLDSV